MITSLTPHMKIFIKKSFYEIGSWPLTQRLVRPWRGKLAILMYHRVLPLEQMDPLNDPNRDLAVSTQLFEEQIQFITNHYPVISMNAVPAHMENPEAPFSIVITFDDGYRDNLLYALPILQKYKVPATIYIATRFPEGDCWMWWFELWELLQNRSVLEYEWNAQIFHWEIRSQKEKLAAFREINPQFLYASNASRYKLMDKLGVVHPRQYTELCLSWEEIIELSKEPLITIGGHTHTHPNLKYLSEEEITEEVVNGKKLLEEKIGKKVCHFAYPYGEAGEREFEMIPRHGFKTAVMTWCEPVTKEKIFKMPRYETSRLRNQELKVKLSGWNAFWKKNVTGSM
ncbi:MAG: polysaccharide deacetylase family protein [SAR324 cluster bacterium]|nr:polysaccharide deacetylase family protein [SAR324 cluster bacterium]